MSITPLGGIPLTSGSSSMKPLPTGDCIEKGSSSAQAGEITESIGFFLQAEEILRQTPSADRRVPASLKVVQGALKSLKEDYTQLVAATLISVSKAALPVISPDAKRKVFEKLRLKFGEREFITEADLSDDAIRRVNELLKGKDPTLFGKLGLAPKDGAVPYKIKTIDGSVKSFRDLVLELDGAVPGEVTPAVTTTPSRAVDYSDITADLEGLIPKPPAATPISWGKPPPLKLREEPPEEKAARLERLQEHNLRLAEKEEASRVFDTPVVPKEITDAVKNLNPTSAEITIARLEQILNATRVDRDSPEGLLILGLVADSVIRQESEVLLLALSTKFDRTGYVYKSTDETGKPILKPTGLGRKPDLGYMSNLFDACSIPSGSVFGQSIQVKDGEDIKIKNTGAGARLLVQFLRGEISQKVPFKNWYAGFLDDNFKKQEKYYLGLDNNSVRYGITALPPSKREDGASILALEEETAREATSLIEVLDHALTTKFLSQEDYNFAIDLVTSRQDPPIKGREELRRIAKVIEENYSALPERIKASCLKNQSDYHTEWKDSEGLNNLMETLGLTERDCRRLMSYLNSKEELVRLSA